MTFEAYWKSPACDWLRAIYEKMKQEEQAK